MEPIYVTGHRNPDTDSIVSAMAYAALRNALGDREYVAARLGQVSDETQMVLDRFGFTAPERIKDMRTQVRDLDYDTPPVLSAGVTVNRAWQVFQEDAKIFALPAVDDGGVLCGILTRGDIAAYDMGSIYHAEVKEVPIFNLLSALEGNVICSGEDDGELLSGEVMIGLPCSNCDHMGITKGSIVLLGDQPRELQKAIEIGAGCVILCQAELPAAMRENPPKVLMINTPLDAYRAARMIYQAIPISRILHTQEIAHFHQDDYLDDVKDIILQSRFRSYPILDENDKVVGTLSRYHLIRPRRKRVVLVDHNEVAQSVPGLEQAEIMEIIDHHRLADVQTGSPIYVRNEPVGSTATIVAGMFQERGLMPSAKMAGLMAAAIVSDTVMFKSPTCTPKDHAMAERLARIAQISLDELGHDIFTASSSEEKPAAEMLASDFKEFHIAGHSIGISQITCMDSMRVLKRAKEFVTLMEKKKALKEYDMMLLMITDVLKEGSELLFIGDKEVIEQAFSVETTGNYVFLPHVVSRKKQIVPALSLLWG